MQKTNYMLKRVNWKETFIPPPQDADPYEW